MSAQQTLKELIAAARAGLDEHQKRMAELHVRLAKLQDELRPICDHARVTRHYVLENPWSMCQDCSHSWHGIGEADAGWDHRPAHRR